MFMLLLYICIEYKKWAVNDDKALSYHFKILNVFYLFKKSLHDIRTITGLNGLSKVH